MLSNCSILIFAFNEEGSIGQVLESVVEFKQKFPNSDVEIIVLNDGSTDKTEEVVLGFQRIFPFIVYHNHPTNLGIGQALRKVYSLASKDYVCAIPADNQFDVNQLSEVNDFDNNTFTSFYRKNPYKSLFRNVLHHSNRYFNFLFFGVKIKDVNWVKVYRKSQLDGLKLELFSSLVESEICIKLIKKKVKPLEIYSPYLPRMAGESKGGSLKTVKKAVSELWVLSKVIRRF